MVSASRWGKRGARLNAIAPGIIVTPLAIDELFLMLFKFARIIRWYRFLFPCNKMCAEAFLLLNRQHGEAGLLSHGGKFGF